MDVEKANEILRQALGRKKFREFLDFITDRLDEKLGKDHNVLIGIMFTDLYKLLVIEIATTLSKSDDLSLIKNIITKGKMKMLLYNSTEDFYKTYKVYIDDVTNYIKIISED